MASTWGRRPALVALTRMSVPSGTPADGVSATASAEAGVCVPHQVRQPLRLSQPTRHHRHVGGPGERRLDDDRPRGTTGAEDAYLRAGGFPHGPQRADEPLTVGVLAGHPAVADDDAVDRPDDPGRVGESVEVLDHRHLVRDRAVEPGPAHRPRPAHGVAQTLRRDLAVEVAGVETVVPVGRLHHRHRRVVGRGGRERAGEEADEAHNVNSILVLPRVLGLTRSRSRNSATPSS